ELRGGLAVVDAAADQPRLRQDHAILPLVPAVADADGAAVGELQRAGDRPRDDGLAHGSPPRCRVPGVVSSVALLYRTRPRRPRRPRPSARWGRRAIGA